MASSGQLFVVRDLWLTSGHFCRIFYPEHMRRSLPLKKERKNKKKKEKNKQTERDKRRRRQKERWKTHDTLKRMTLSLNALVILRSRTCYTG